MKTVIMAGGEGRRLKPLTNDIPKPLLPIGKKPILQIIIEQLRKYNLKEIIITTSYKSHLIKDYFKDGKEFGVNISYFYEENKLGTAGSLRLLENKLNSIFFLINGDILTEFNFRKIINSHYENGAYLTVGVTKYKVNIPYGIIDYQDDKIVNIQEKPNYHYRILAGIYVINPMAIKYIPSNQSYDMPDLIRRLLDDKKEVKYYLIEDEWVDIGNLKDYEYVTNNHHKWSNL